LKTNIPLNSPGASVFFKLLTGEIRKYIIEWVKPHQRRLLIGFTGIDTRDQAEKLVGSELLMNRADLPEPDEGTYYWDDIIGLTVFTVHNEILGCVTSIIRTGSNDVYVVKRSDEDDSVEILIPALESVVVAIDLEKKTMRVDLPEGL